MIHLETVWTVLELPTPDSALGNQVWTYTAIAANGDNLYEIQIPQFVLNRGTLYQFQMYYNYLDDAGVYQTTPTYVVNAETPLIADPVITLENENYSNNVQSFIPTGPVVDGGLFDTLVGADTHMYTDWSIADTLGNTVWSSLNNAQDLTTIDVPDGTLQPGTDYVVGVCYYGKSDTIGSCTSRLFRTYEPVIIQPPTITTPDQPDGVHRLAVFTSSAFTPLHPDNTPFPNGDIHLATRWILTNLDTNTVLIDYTTSVASQLTQLDMATWEAVGVTLDPGTNYEITAEYIGVLASATGQLLFSTPLIDPIVLNIQGAPDGVYKTPTINTDPVNVALGSDQVLAATWRVIEVSTGNIVVGYVNSNVNITSIPSPTLSQGTTYRVEVEWFTRSGFDLSATLTASTPRLAVPVIAVQDEPNSVPPEPVLTGTAFATTQGTDSHASSYWVIEESDGAGGWVNVWDSGVTNIDLLTIQATDPVDNVVVIPLTDYRARVVYTGVTGFSVSSDWDYFTGVTPVVQPPVINAPCFPNNVDILPTFTLSPYTSTFQSVNTFQSALIEVYEINPDGTTGALLESSGLLNVDPTSWTMTVQLDYSKDYRVIATHNGLFTSAQSTADFTTVQLTATVFTVVEPTNGTIINTPGTDIVLLYGNGQITNLFNHTATDWQVVETATGNLVWESLNDQVNLTSISLPDNTLSPGVDYTIRVRIYMDGCPSGWTETPYTLPEIQPPIVQNIYYDVQGPSSNTNVIMELSPFTMLNGTDTFNRTEVSVFDVTNNVDLGIIALNYDTDNGTFREINITLPNFDNDYIFNITYYGNSGSYSVPPTQQAFRTAPQYTLQPISITVEGQTKSVPDDPLITASSAIPSSGVNPPNPGTVTSTMTIMRRFYDATSFNTVGTNTDYTATISGEFSNWQLNPGDLQIGCHPSASFLGNNSHYAQINVTTDHATINSTFHYFTVAKINTPSVSLPGGNTDVSLAADVTVNGSSFTVSPAACGATETHLSTNWNVLDPTNTVVYSLVGTTANGSLTSISIPASLLTLGTTYTVTAEYVGQYQTSSVGSTQFSTQALPYFSTPVLTVAGAPNNVAATPTMSIDPVTITPTGSDTHVSTIWTVYDSAGTIVYTATTSGASLLSHTIPASSALPNGNYTFGAVAVGNLNNSAEAVVGPYTIGTIDTPTITVEGSPASVPNGPLLTLSPYNGGGNFTTMDIEIRDTANPTTIYYSANAVPGATTYQVPAGYMPASTQMDFRVRYYDDTGAVSSWGSTTATTAAYPATIAPTITVQDEPNAGASPGAIINFTGFQQAWTNSSTYQSTTVTVVEFTGGVVGATVYNATNLSAAGGGSVTVPEANLQATDYRVSVTHVGSAGGDPTATHVFTWHKVSTPTITSPANNTNLTDNNLTVQTSAFSVSPTNPNITHQSTDWYLWDTATGTIVWQSVNDTNNLTSITLPPNTLQYAKTYGMAVRYNGTNGNSVISSQLFNDPANPPVWSVSTPPGVFSEPDFIFTGSPDTITQRFVIRYRPFTDDPPNTFGTVSARYDLIEEDTGNVLVTRFSTLSRTTDVINSYNTLYTLTNPSTNYILKVRYQSQLNGVWYYGPEKVMLLAEGENSPSWSFVSNKIPTPKAGAGYCRLPDGRYAFGMGANAFNSTTGRTNVCRIADKEFNTITTIASTPGAFQGPAWAVVDYYRFVSIGGRTTTTNARNRVYLYDLRTNSWSNLASLPAPRYSAAAVTIPTGDIVVFGGAFWDATLNKYQFGRNVYSYDFYTATWVSRTSLPYGMAYHRVILTSDKKVLIFATRKWDAATNSEVTANEIIEYDWYSEFVLGITDPNILYKTISNFKAGTNNDTVVYRRLGVAELYSGRYVRSYFNGGVPWDRFMPEAGRNDNSGLGRYQGDWFADGRNRVFTIHQNTNTSDTSAIAADLGVYKTEDYEDITIKTIGDHGTEDPGGLIRVCAENTSGINYDTLVLRVEDDTGTDTLGNGGGVVVGPPPVGRELPYSGGLLETDFFVPSINVSTGKQVTATLMARFQDSTGANQPTRWFRKKINDTTTLGKFYSETVFNFTIPTSEITLDRNVIRASDTKLVMPFVRQNQTTGNSESGLIIFDETTNNTVYINADSVVSTLWFSPLDGYSFASTGKGIVYLWRTNFITGGREMYQINTNNNTVTRLGDLPFTPTYATKGEMINVIEFVVPVGKFTDTAGNTFINSVWKYNINTDTWTRLNDYFPQTSNDYRSNNFSKDRHGRLVMWSWWTNTLLSGNPTTAYASIYDPSTDTWEHTKAGFRTIPGAVTSDAPPDTKAGYDYNNILTRFSVSADTTGTYLKVAATISYLSDERRLSDNKLVCATNKNYYITTDTLVSSLTKSFGYGLTENLPDGKVRIWTSLGYITVGGFPLRHPHMK